jgi:hypothetical protein
LYIYIIYKILNISKKYPAINILQFA